MCTVVATSGALDLVAPGSCEVTVTAAATSNYNETETAVTVTVDPVGALSLTLDTIAEDGTVNIAEKAAGFAIGGTTGSEAGVTVSVTLGTEPALTATSAADGAWSVPVPATAAYLSGTGVALAVTAAKTGYTSPAPLSVTLALDLTAPTAPGYSAPASLTVGTAIDNIYPAGGADIDNYSAPALPPGLGISASTGVISGAPTTATASTPTVTLTVTDTAANSATVDITFPAVAKGTQDLSGFGYTPGHAHLRRPGPGAEWADGGRECVAELSRQHGQCVHGRRHQRCAGPGGAGQL